MGERRASLSARLNSLLLNSDDPQRRASTSTSLSEPPSRRSGERLVCNEDMRLARTRPPSPRLSNSQRAAALMSRSNHSSKSLSTSMPFGNPKPPSRSHKRESSQPTLPVFRWFTGQHTSKPISDSRADTPLQESPLSTRPSSPTSATSALADALQNDDPHILRARSPSIDLPSRPEAARLPPRLPNAFRASRPPHYLSNLTRPTLPTACISPPSSASVYKTSYADPFEDPLVDAARNIDRDLLLSPTPEPLAIPHTPAPAHLSSSPPTICTSPPRSSTETLRSIQERGRGYHTTAAVQSLWVPDSIRGWFSSEDSLNKENMDALLEERDQAQEGETQKQHIRKIYASPKNPVVFCHGLLGFDTVTLGPSIAPLQVTHWRGIKDALEANGTEVLITRVPATSSPVDRAKVLEEKISAVYPGRSVHLIGHSMGGLDCRYLTTHLTQRTFTVLSITTIATPHRGSSFADHFLSTVGPERFPSVLNLLDLLPNGGGDGKAFEFLTVDNMRKFNEQTPDVPGVKYYSWGAEYEPGLIDTWKWSHSVILEKEGPNDGLVSVQSAKWGTYLGTLEGVNHLDLVGWINPARYQWAKIMGREIKYKPGTFYLGIADHLARVVEGAEEQQKEARSCVESAETESERREREEIMQEGERAEMADSLGKGKAGGVHAGRHSGESEREARRKSVHHEHERRS